MGVPARAFSIFFVGCAALVLAACQASGSSGTSAVRSSASGPAKEPSPASLASSMQDSVRSAASVHVSGQLSRNGVPLGVDLDATKTGDVAGTISQRGTPLQVIAASGKVYILATPAFLREVGAPAGACASACGKWFELTSGEAGQLTGHFSLQDLVTPLASARAPKLTAAGSTTVHGQPAWLLRASDGSTVAVSASGKHYPLWSSSAGSPHQVVSYTQWNTAPAPKPPPASQLIHMSGGMPPS